MTSLLREGGPELQGKESSCLLPLHFPAIHPPRRTRARARSTPPSGMTEGPTAASASTATPPAATARRPPSSSPPPPSPAPGGTSPRSSPSTSTPPTATTPAPAPTSVASAAARPWSSSTPPASASAPSSRRRRRRWAPGGPSPPSGRQRGLAGRRGCAGRIAVVASHGLGGREEALAAGWGAACRPVTRHGRMCAGWWNERGGVAVP